MSETVSLLDIVASDQALTASEILLAELVIMLEDRFGLV